LKAFLNGASVAQRAQVAMIREVFEAMDADKDGLLTVKDLGTYFRSVGRAMSDLDVRRWIAARDVDQDGAVSLTEYVASFAQQLDPASSLPQGTAGAATVSAVSPVASAFGCLRLGSTLQETLAACEAAEVYVTRILDSPSVAAFWSLQVAEANFRSKIGRLFGGLKLMGALGFVTESNGAVLALRDPNGKKWDTVPQAVRTVLNTKLEELRSHRAALYEPTISNIAAGLYKYPHMVYSLVFTAKLQSLGRLAHLETTQAERSTG
jgi:hypothetical protein